MAFFTQDGGLKRCERWSNALQKVAFCSVKGHLLQSFRTCVIEALTVSRWFIALYVKCRKMPFFRAKRCFCIHQWLSQGLKRISVCAFVNIIMQDKNFYNTLFKELKKL